MNQRNMLENPDSETTRKAEGKGRKTPMLQGVAKITRGSGENFFCKLCFFIHVWNFCLDRFLAYFSREIMHRLMSA